MVYKWMKSGPHNYGPYRMWDIIDDSEVDMDDWELFTSKIGEMLCKPYFDPKPL